MQIDKVMEVLNEALKQNDLDLWLKDDQIKELKKEIEKLKAEIEELKQKKDW